MMHEYKVGDMVTALVDFCNVEKGKGYEITGVWESGVYLNDYVCMSFDEIVVRNEAGDTHTTSFKKFDDGKPELKYILDTPLSTAEVSKVRKFGDDKYGRLNWYECDNPERYMSALLRHVFANGDQELKKDSESGLDHLAHALCSLQFFYELKLREQEASND